MVLVGTTLAPRRARDRLFVCRAGVNTYLPFHGRRGRGALIDNRPSLLVREVVRRDAGLICVVHRE
jgi:hypothetical protein